MGKHPRRPFLMNNYTTLNQQLKRYSHNFLDNFTNNAPFNDKRTVYDLFYGIACSKSTKLSDIARSLNEDVKIESTITRLSRNVNDDQFNINLMSDGYVSEVKKITTDEIVINVDDTDIAKPYATKLEYLDKVIDGSSKDKKIINGYKVLEMTTVSRNTKQPITIYSKIYSARSKEYVSKNVILHNAIKSVVDAYGNAVTFVFDRGFDDIKLMKYLKKLKVKYIIRMTRNRKVKYQSKTMNYEGLCYRCKGKIKIDFKGREEQLYLKVSHLKVALCSDANTRLYAVVVHGFGESPMVLLTNIDILGKEEVKGVFWKYMKRWKIEEMFRYNKNEFDYEGVRVRTIGGMQVMINVIHLVNLVQIKLLESDTSLLGYTILEFAKIIKKDASFLLYRMSRGISEILSKSRSSLLRYIKKKRQTTVQLMLQI